MTCLHVWGAHWEHAAVQLRAFWMQVVLPVHGQHWGKGGHQTRASHMTTSRLRLCTSLPPPTSWLCLSQYFNKDKCSPWPGEGGGVSWKGEEKENVMLVNYLCRTRSTSYLTEAHLIQVFESFLNFPFFILRNQNNKGNQN